MPQESRLEKFIKDFVQAKIAEAVYLYLDDAIIIRPSDKKGSMFLASFWAKILQHELNYPPIQYKYRRQVLESVEHLALETKEVKFAINMTTGALIMRGPFIYDWFTAKFRNVLENFDSDFTKSWTFIPTEPGDLPAVGKTTQDDYEKTETEAYLLMENRGQRMNAEFEQKLKTHCHQYLVADVGDLSLSKPVWSASEISHQMDLLESGGNYETSVYIYPLWRSLLHHWFKQHGANIYLSTPLLDAERLQELIEVVLDCQSFATLRSFYIRFDCDPDSNTNAGALQKKVLKYYSKQQQVNIEYKVFRSMTYPLDKLLSAFVAIVYGDVAKVFITSANYHRNHLERKGVASAICVKMSEKNFMEKYIKPLETPPALSTLSL